MSYIERQTEQRETVLFPVIMFDYDVSRTFTNIIVLFSFISSVIDKEDMQR